MCLDLYIVLFSENEETCVSTSVAAFAFAWRPTQPAINIAADYLLISVPFPICMTAGLGPEPVTVLQTTVATTSPLESGSDNGLHEILGSTKTEARTTAAGRQRARKKNSETAAGNIENAMVDQGQRAQLPGGTWGQWSTVLQ